MAADYLRSLGFEILENNYYYRKAEIDIIARKENLLLIVEVKFRSTAFYEELNQAIPRKKIGLLVMAADHYIEQCNLEVEVRFDIICLFKKGQGIGLDHLVDAFYYF